MFGTKSFDEERIEKLATQVLSYAQETQISLTDGLRKIATDYGLSSAEIENVCGRVNHIHFSNKFAEDKLVSFKRAVFEDVIGSTTKTAGYRIYSGKLMKNVYEYLDKEAAVADVASEGEFAEPRKFKQSDTQRKSSLIDAASRNVDTLNEMDSNRNAELDKMRNTIIQLAQSGESLNNIYEVIYKTWGKENVGELDRYFAELIGELKADGYLSSKDELKIPGIEDIPDRGIAETPLQKSAEAILKLSSEIIKREIVHYNLQDMLKEAGEHVSARMVDEIAGDEFVVADIIAASIEKDANFLKTIGKALKASGVDKAILAGTALAVPSAIFGASIARADDVALKMKTKKIQTSLPNRFPELKEIPAQKYIDIYETLTALTPVLLKAPYALAETIKGVYNYDTIDVGKITSLISAKGKQPSIGAEALMKNLSQGIGSQMPKPLDAAAKFALSEKMKAKENKGKV